MALLQRLSLLLTGLLTGWDAIFVVPVNGPYKSLSGPEYASAHRSIVQVAGPTAPFLAVPLLVADALLLRASWKARNGGADRVFGWTALSFSCVLLNAAITVAVNLPINERFLRATEQPPEDWARLRDRWAAAHNARTCAQVLGFVALIHGLVGRRA